MLPIVDRLENIFMRICNPMEYLSGDQWDYLNNEYELKMEATRKYLEDCLLFWVSIRISEYITCSISPPLERRDVSEMKRSMPF